MVTKEDLRKRLVAAWRVAVQSGQWKTVRRLRLRLAREFMQAPPEWVKRVQGRALGEQA